MSIGSDDLPRLSEENRCLPRNADGHIVSPRYSKGTYLAKWGEWCRKNPRETWPEWLKKDVDILKHKPTFRGRNSTAGSPPSTPPTTA